ncbi:uncharacterized protein LOC133896951 [Phragmites australis]|uniref:uncharacterized protein LOC133896951 n=1 Tax=Phragmites australis TaxID=29695 RepID=UPI002D77892C|nr:uncharacterized protein LOC133896951 [Phragmites australis]
MPLGQIELPITFGKPDNFCIEKLTFDDADFDIVYNVILGRSILDRFMVIVQYAYQAFKIPGPKERRGVQASEASSRHAKVKDSKLVRLMDASKSDDTAKGDTNDGAKDKKVGSGIKAVPLDHMN